MQLIQRSPRPLSRDKLTFRDDRLFIVACDDTYAPKQYFERFRLPRVQIHVSATLDGRCAARDVLDRLLKIQHESDDELWMLLDTDHYIRGQHLKGYVAALRAARRKGVKVAISRPCFELWLLLHRLELDRIAMVDSDSASVTKMLREILGGYDKSDILPERFTFDQVSLACKRAKVLDAETQGRDIPETMTDLPPENSTR